MRIATVIDDARVRAPVAWRVALVVLAAFAAPAAPAAAQIVEQAADPATLPGTVTLVGTVRDTAGRALEGAEVRVGERFDALSDASGAFALRGVPAADGADTVRLVVRRIGFERREVRVPVAGAGRRVTLDVRLVPTVLALRTVVVEGRAVDAALHDVGYYRRERQSRGAFFDADDLRHFGGAGLGSLLRQVPRVMVDRVNNEEFAYSPIAGTRCRMHVFVDGQYARAAMPGSNGDPGVSLTTLVPREELHAVEVYPTMNSVPAEFVRIGPASGGSGRASTQIPSPMNTMRQRRGGEAAPVEASNDAACGAIVIWTRTFTAKQ